MMELYPHWVANQSWLMFGFPQPGKQLANRRDVHQFLFVEKFVPAVPGSSLDRTDVTRFALYSPANGGTIGE
jgi:hypothetical protein